MTIKVVVVEDQKTVLAALMALLRLDGDFDVLGGFSDPNAALAALSDLKPDVVVSDIQMPGLNGLEFARSVRADHPNVRVVLLSVFARAGYVREALRLGVSGYLLKDAPPERLAEAVRAAAAGRRMIESTLLDLQEVATRPSERDCALLHLVREGLSNAEIAAALGLGEGTVKTSSPYCSLSSTQKTASRPAGSRNATAGCDRR